MERACTSCGAELETPLACTSCGVLASVEGRELTPFEVLGLEPRFDVDPKDAKKRLRRFTRLVHPDFFATEGGAVLELAEEHNARLNEAHAIVADDARRADWLVRHLGGPAEKELGCMPQAFLMEVMEWNETLEEHEPGSPAFESLAVELRAEREHLIALVATAFGPLSSEGTVTADALKDVRKNLNALRYVDRALSRVAGEAVTL